MTAACQTIYLYGNASACEKACLLLENLREVRRLQPISSSSFRLYLTSPVHENSLIPLLAQSGISGFRLE